ncbi:MAG: hypothetical protein ABIJ09_18695 [Pseudomonadota bacterium]
MIRPYRPSGKSEPGSMFKLLVVSSVAGVMAGAVEGVIMHLGFNLFIVFPAAIGLAAGAVGSRIIRTGKIRAPGQAALVVGLAALLGQGVTHVASYMMWRGEARAEVTTMRDRSLADPGLSAEDRAEIEGTTADAQVDQFLASEVGSTGFFGYLRFAAQVGVTIGRVGESEDKKPTLTGAGTYAVWGVEFAIALLVGLAMAYGKAREPFCETCKAWFDQTLVLAVGDGKKAQLKQQQQALESEQFDTLLTDAVLGQPGAGLSSVLVLDRCRTCEEHEPVLTLKMVRETKGKVQSTDKIKTVLRADDARRLVALAEKRMQTAVAAEAPAESSEPVA